MNAVSAPQSFRLPFTFLFTGLLGFVLLQGLAFVWLPALTSGFPRTPNGWGVAHLFVLGFATMIAMGAVYQLIPVVLQVSLQNVWIGFVHYALYALGMIGLVSSFFAGNVPLLVASAVLLVTAILVFVCYVGTTVLRAKLWNAITLHVGSALLYLLLTAVIGLLMGLNFRYGFWTGLHDRLLATHIWFGLCGWFLFLIVGFSYKMVPMFCLAHGYPVRLQTLTLICFHLGLLVMAGSLLTGAADGWRSLALALLECGVILYVVHVRQIVAKSYKKQPGSGIQFTIWLARGLAVLGGVAFLHSLLQPQAFADMKVLLVYVYLFLGGWLTLTILGYLSKIVPFLWWTHKYGNRVGQEAVPAMAQMIDDRLVRSGLWAMLGSLLLVVIGIALPSAGTANVGQVLLSLTSLFYLVQIVRVLFK